MLSPSLSLAHLFDEQSAILSQTLGKRILSPTQESIPRHKNYSKTQKKLFPDTKTIPRHKNYSQTQKTIPRHKNYSQTQKNYSQTQKLFPDTKSIPRHLGRGFPSLCQGCPSASCSPSIPGTSPKLQKYLKY